jgi:hypothetical protein
MYFAGTSIAFRPADRELEPAVTENLAALGRWPRRTGTSTPASLFRITGSSLVDKFEMPLVTRVALTRLNGRRHQLAAGSFCERRERATATTLPLWLWTERVIATVQNPEITDGLRPLARLKSSERPKGRRRCNWSCRAGKCQRRRRQMW